MRTTTMTRPHADTSRAGTAGASSKRELHLRTTDNVEEHGGDAVAKAVGSALDEHINLEVLMSLKSAFHKADTDGGGDLSIEEFVEAFAEVVSSSIDEAKLRQLFTRVDANGEGTWRWQKTTDARACVQGSRIFTRQLVTEPKKKKKKTVRSRARNNTWIAS